MHPDWLSNAYLIADEEGGAAVFVDSGADVEPLLAAAERWRVQPSYVLRTPDGSAPVLLSVPGEHMVGNALAAALAGLGEAGRDAVGKGRGEIPDRCTRVAGRVPG